MAGQKKIAGENSKNSWKSGKIAELQNMKFAVSRFNSPEF
jgi:hypothetical protein